MQSKLTNTTRMSGKIYAKDLEKILPLDEKDIGEGSPEIFDKLSDKVVIDLQNAMIEQYLDKKAQLISFLEDKIKECEKEIEKFLDREYYCIALDKKEAFQEVLDFVNKGGKE